MHWLNWYTAMGFNRMLYRTGHFWEKRYYSSGFPNTDQQRALNTLRYIHANPKATSMQRGWFYDFSNYGTYNRLASDGLTQWHPAFLLLGTTLEACAAAYRKFCERYQPKPKTDIQNYWGSQLLARLKLSNKPKKHKKKSPGQMKLWDDWLPAMDAVHAVAKRFVLANCLNPDIAAAQFSNTS
mgnify:FL=1